MRTNADVTIYNKYYDTATKTDKYQRTVIYDVAWVSGKGKNTLATGGNIKADQATIYIPLVPHSPTYKDAPTWQVLVSKSGYWTLQSGDYIVRGEKTDEISSSFTIAQLKAKYYDVLQITSVDTMDLGSLGLQHWQVGAA